MGDKPLRGQLREQVLTSNLRNLKWYIPWLGQEGKGEQFYTLALLQSTEAQLVLVCLTQREMYLAEADTGHCSKLGQRGPTYYKAKK